MIRYLLPLALAGMTSSAVAAEAQLPKTMVWTAYDLGSSGHAEASGIANALSKNYDTRIRIVPAGTSIGRMLPMVTGKATYGFLANEVYFATEAIYDFASEDWGPQNLRVILGRVASTGMAVAADTGVKEVADLKGKRIGYVKANPSVNVKTDAIWAFAGMTRDDVQPVWFGSYSALKTALLANQIDAYGSVPTAASVREIEASPRGLTWVQLDPNNKKGWEAITDVVSFAEPYRETKGAGISEEKPVWMLGYRYPMISVYEGAASADEVYQLVKAMDESFDDYKFTTPSADNWAVVKSGRPPYDAPAHEGTIRYMKEKDLWRDQDQAWHEKRLERLNRVIALWDEAQAEFNDWRVAEDAKGNKVDPVAEWPEYWDKYRADKLN